MAASAEVWGIVVAAGTGSRFGSPKQYAPLDGARVLDHAVAAARSVCTGVVLVVPPERASDPEPGADVVVPGGGTRSASVRAGLEVVPADAGVVVVHDAARPWASPGLFRAVVSAVAAGADGAVCGVPVTDTVKVLAGPPSPDGPAEVVSTPPRDRLVAVQTPQAFRAGALRSAHASGADATDDAALVEAAGGRVVVVPGDPANRKITRPEDLGSGPRPGVTDSRVGYGFDVHRFSEEPGRPLVLAGVRLPGPGLLGHSDADVIAHAVADALLGAAGLGDLGGWFPDDDDRWAGADSLALLRRVTGGVRSAGWRVVNVDVAVICERPRLAPHRSTMAANLSACVAAPVNIKANRAEGLGALGRAEGIAAHAVVLCRRDPEAGG